MPAKQTRTVAGPTSSLIVTVKPKARGRPRGPRSKVWRKSTAGRSGWSEVVSIAEGLISRQRSSRPFIYIQRSFLRCFPALLILCKSPPLIAIVWLHLSVLQGQPMRLQHKVKYCVHLRITCCATGHGPLSTVAWSGPYSSSSSYLYQFIFTTFCPSLMPTRKLSVFIIEDNPALCWRHVRHWQFRSTGSFSSGCCGCR
jgi:hypothetical protein